MATSIIGGGIAGLGASIALAKAGHSVVIYERAKAFTTIGAGVQLGPNAVRALQKLGAWDAVEPFTTQPKALSVFNGTSGKMIRSINLARFEARFGAPYRVILRADLHAALLQVVQSFASIEIQLGSTQTAQALTGPVIAADGIWSQSRTDLFGATAQTAQATFYRALCDPLPDTAVDLENVTLWQYPGGHVVHYLVGQKPKLNFVAISPSDPFGFFSRAAPELAKLLVAAQPMSEWPAAYLDPLQFWHKGNVLLIGDAAHGTLPYLAQGAAMALEDAATLLSLDDFANFQNARKARCVRLHLQTMRQGKINHLAGPLALARDLTLRALPEAIFFNQLAWIYEA